MTAIRKSVSPSSVAGAMQDLHAIRRRFAIVACAGFEPRSPRALDLVADSGMIADAAIILTYTGPEHAENAQHMLGRAREVVGNPKAVQALPVSSDSAVADFLRDNCASDTAILLDITGLSRAAMLQLLTRLWRSRYDILILYTEAAEYYPRYDDFEIFLLRDDDGEAFMKLVEYEEAEIVYSAECDVHEIPLLSGRFFPGHPILLVSFLTFKRSRLAAVLTTFESNRRLFIKGVPVKPALQWRGRALDIINFDLAEDASAEILELPAPGWREVLAALDNFYNERSRRYRYNTILAPLGGKLHTFAAWCFAIRYPEVKIVTSTPRRIFWDKYSIGYGDTHVIDCRAAFEEDMSDSGS